MVPGILFMHSCEVAVDSVNFDNLLNCLWRPEETEKESILLVSSSSVAIYEDRIYYVLINRIQFCDEKRFLVNEYGLQKGIPNENL